MTLCRCDQCGEFFDETKIVHRRTFHGNSGPLDDRSPDEYVEVCPYCREEECIEHGADPDDEEDSWYSDENQEPII